MTQSLNHSFSLELAQEYGIECAILIHHFQHWIMVNKRLGRNFHQDRTWTYQTLQEIAGNFPYLSFDQIRRTIDKLLQKNVLIKGNFNKNTFDRVSWYAFENEEMFGIGKFENAHLANLPNADGEYAKSDLANLPNDNKEQILNTHTKTNISSTVVDKPSAIASGLTSFFIKKIKELKPDFKKPNLTTWSKLFDQMLRLDKRDPEQIKRVIEWTLNDAFWKDNVLSPKKLREKFDQLELKMQNKNLKTFPTGNMSNSNQELAKKVQLKFGTRKDITFGYNYLEFDNVRSVEQIKFDEKGFTERAIAQLKRRNLSLEGIV